MSPSSYNLHLNQVTYSFVDSVHYVALALYYLNPTAIFKSCWEYHPWDWNDIIVEIFGQTWTTWVTIRDYVVCFSGNKHIDYSF